MGILKLFWSQTIIQINNINNFCILHLSNTVKINKYIIPHEYVWIKV